MTRWVAVLLVLLATIPAGAQAPPKVKLGVLKLTSSAVLFLGVEKGYFREFGVEPELVNFQAAQPIAVELASGAMAAVWRAAGGDPAWTRSPAKLGTHEAAWS